MSGTPAGRTGRGVERLLSAGRRHEMDASAVRMAASARKCRPGPAPWPAVLGCGATRVAVSAISRRAGGVMAAAPAVLAWLVE
jgi:hypothetical protein